MSKRGGKNRNHNTCANGFRQYGSGYTTQSGVLNARTYRYYINVMMQMAMSRFRWVNLPPTCDERYLEYILLTEGVATIAFPHRMHGTFMSLKAATEGPWTMYGNPSKWQCIGDNGSRFFANNNNGVLVWDNAARYPLMNGIELYANELTHIRMTKRVNRLHQQIPFILTGPQEKKQDMTNLFKQVAGGEPAVIGTDSLNDLSYNALSTGVQFLGEELASDELNVWNRVYTMLGIANTLYKTERQTEDEIRAQMAPTTLVKMNSLEERRRAAKKLNERFSEYLDPDKPISVVWRQDNESENWNYLHNIESQIRLDSE